MKLPEPNRRVSIAIARLADEPGHATRTALYRELASGGHLAIAVDRLPTDIDPSGVLLSDAQLNILTSSAPDGGTALVAFTDIDAVRARAPTAEHIAMPARDVLEQVIRNSYAAVVLNPAGPWAAIPYGDVARILDGSWFDERA